MHIYSFLSLSVCVCVCVSVSVSVCVCVPTVDEPWFTKKEKLFGFETAIQVQPL